MASWYIIYYGSRSCCLILAGICANLSGLWADDLLSMFVLFCRLPGICILSRFLVLPLSPSGILSGEFLDVLLVPGCCCPVVCRSSLIRTFLLGLPDSIWPRWSEFSKEPPWLSGSNLLTVRGFLVVLEALWLPLLYFAFDRPTGEKSDLWCLPYSPVSTMWEELTELLILAFDLSNVL